MAGVDYYQHLCSREWALKRKAVRERAGGICEQCEKAPLKDTHHLTYRNLGNEPLEDLMGVCRPCHQWLSGKSDYNPAEEREADCTRVQSPSSDARASGVNNGGHYRGG
jgi:5-methylcytosine-specific restriction endonuclease McrA